MKAELVFRTNDMKEFEILKYQNTYQNVEKYQSKSLKLESLIELLSDLENQGIKKESTLYETNIYELQNNCIAFKKTNLKETFVFDFKEQYIRTFYNDKYFKVLHCNAFIKLNISNGLAEDMYIYPYKENLGLETKLYDNPFPNGYSGNKTCLGTANRKVEKNKIKTILSLLETSYTHSNTNFKTNDLKETKVAFEFLSKTSKFPYDKLYSLNKRLKDIL